MDPKASVDREEKRELKALWVLRVHADSRGVTRRYKMTLTGMGSLIGWRVYPGPTRTIGPMCRLTLIRTASPMFSEAQPDLQDRPVKVAPRVNQARSGLKGLEASKAHPAVMLR